MVELADIVRQHGPSYLQQRAGSLRLEQRRALTDIAKCHTHEMGGVFQFCPKCGFSQFIGYSCRNRACPRCHGKHGAKWLKARLDEMLPVSHYHIVFTVPQSLHGLIRTHADCLLDQLVRCCAQTILQLAKDPRWLGGQPALLTVLHTAKRDLGYHPHVHCVVSAGGYDSSTKQWVAAPKPNFLFPQRVLGRLLREKLLDSMRASIPGCKLPKGLYKSDWVVHCEGSHTDNSSHVLRYLARYVFRLPLCNGRIIAADQEKVIYRYRPNGSAEDKLLSIDPHAFLDRYLQHVLPKGFHAVRYWGLWTTRRRLLLRQLQLLLSHPLQPSVESEPLNSAAKVKHCLHCGTLLEHIQVSPLGAHDVPRRRWIPNSRAPAVANSPPRPPAV